MISNSGTHKQITTQLILQPAERMPKAEKTTLLTLKSECGLSVWHRLRTHSKIFRCFHQSLCEHSKERAVYRNGCADFSVTKAIAAFLFSVCTMSDVI